MFVFREIQPADEAAWDKLVRVSPQGNAFLRIGTLRGLAAHERPAARVWRVGAFQEDGTLAAGWAVLARSRAGIHYCSSFPLFYAGPILTPEWTINFGGSPNLSLARFKDYLGAVPTPHWRIRWQRPGAKALLWNSLQAVKEGGRRHLTLWKVIRPPRSAERQAEEKAEDGGR